MSREMIPELCRFPSYLHAYPILDEHEEDFLGIVTRAWDRYLETPPEIRFAVHRIDRSRAGVVSALMADEAEKVFDGRRDNGIIPRDRYKPAMWSFGNRVLVRFKKMDENGFSRNYRTERAEKINSGQIIPEELLTETVRVDVGYRLNKLKSDIEEILISRRNGWGRVEWKYGITRDGESLVLPFYGDDSGGPDLDEGGSFIRPRKPNIGTGGGERREGTNESDER